MSLNRSTDRRRFLTVAGAAAATLGWSAAHRGELAMGSAPAPFAGPGLAGGNREPGLQISLAQWSLHRTLGSGELQHLDFARFAREEFEIGAVEYVNSFFRDKASDAAYLADMNKRCADHGVKSLLIMVDGEGALGAPDRKERLKTVANHHRWADAAAALGCHSIRVNAQSSGSYEEQQKLAADGLALLAQYCAALKLNVIVENHGGLSSNGAWLAGTIGMVDLPNCGTLPDFGNFRISGEEAYDNYLGVQELMPFAKAVSAKSYDFDEAGNETQLDYPRLIKIVAEAGYKGWVGIEYEGGRMSEKDGIRATRDLLVRCFAELKG